MKIQGVRTILTVLDALQVPQLRLVQQAKGLPRRGSHCGHCNGGIEDENATAGTLVDIDAGGKRYSPVSLCYDTRDGGILEAQRCVCQA